MNRNFSSFFGTSALLTLMFLLFSGTARGGTCEKWAGKVTSAQGVVESLAVGETAWQPVKLNDTLCPGDQVRVQERSRADIVLANEALMRLDENSSLTLEDMVEEKTSVVDLFKGAGHFFSSRPNSLEVKTPYTAAGVRGTEFLIKVEENKTSLSIFAGAVLAQNDLGRLELTSGQSAVAEAGKAPVLKVVVRPRDAVQWALYYPPVIYAAPEKTRPGGEDRDARLYAQRASDLLAVGRVNEANESIGKALALAPDFGDAYALQSIIATVQNDKDKALGLARKAVTADPGSAAAWVALSYAQQSRFDLEGARKSIQEAVVKDPRNALAWARFAELWSMFGNMDRSLDAAQKAVALDPNLSRTQTVLGFAYLTQIRIDKAKKAFEKAVELDQADPMPRLGLGLAIIRDGNLREGGKQLEIAASLDPNNSLVRSYLGKTYFEEKRTGLDEREYNVAKQLDPSDPTPWFYDAITKQTENRPVEALQEMEKSVQLNDNRAVYRSKLLLDSDEAARSASLARIYVDLGFQQRGLAEGWSAVNLDPTEYSAHRFLADLYSVLPRHEIARVSELLMSQLLQPVNIAPIQPTLGEADLFLTSAQGPSTLSSNEFNTLFNRNRVTLETSGMAGNLGTYGAEGIVSGIWDNLSFSSGYSRFQTNGWRPGAFQTDNLYDAFGQYQLSYKTSIQAEYRLRSWDMGDTTLRFLPGDFFPEADLTDTTTSARFGFHHAFSPDSHLLGNFTYQNANEDQFYKLFFDFDRFMQYPFYLIPTLAQSGYNGELQYLYRSENFNVVTGAGYFHIRMNEVDFQNWPAFDIFQSTFIPSDTDHVNAYFYSYIGCIRNTMITLGVSGDFYNQENKTDTILSGVRQTRSSQDLNVNQVNPKLGISWEPIPGTVFRAATFRTLKRTLLTEQTLEPTQVAGFNQFFDDINATRTWVYGAAVDQKFSECLFGGLEFYRRDLDVPWTSLTSSQLLTTSWSEDIGRAYLYWTPHKWVALTAEYQYEMYDRGIDFLGPANIEDVTTHKVPLGINFFHPSGWSLGLQGTYYAQEGDFTMLKTTGSPSTNPNFFQHGQENFFVMDAFLRYRLPKRYGFISFGVKNLTDRHFLFADTDFNNPLIRPDRTYMGMVTLFLP